MGRVFRVWALVGIFALLSQSSYNNMVRFKVQLPDLEQLVGSFATEEIIMAKAKYPDNLTYFEWIESYTDRRNVAWLMSSNNSTEEASPMLSYFPDFCADCMWGAQQTCAGRVDFLRSKYGTKDTENVVMKDRAVCRNPPFRIFWEDDGVDELDSIFALPRMSRRNVTTTTTTSAHAGNLSVYFYETLANDAGAGLVERMRARYALRNNSETNAQADVAIIDLFRTFPGRTDDPASADVFVVPYPHASHCVAKLTGVWKAACGHMDYNLVKNGVFGRLEHYAGNRERHLFLNVINQGNSNPILRDTHLSLDIGPRYKDTNLLVPYLNNLPSFQPSAIRGRGEAWWTRPRTYALTYFFGVSNSKMRNSPRVYRQSFLAEVQKNWPDTLGGLPYAIRVMTRGNKPPSRLFTHMYKDSVFCPTLPGDTPPQKRFFDVIMMGCIPVVLEFEAGNGGRSWHQPGGQPIENSYPWIKGSNSVHPKEEIDYRSFVVVVNGTVENVRPTIEAILRNYTEVRRRQLALMEVAPYFSYGAGSDAHKHPDAFSKILESLRFYLDGPLVGE